MRKLLATLLLISCLIPDPAAADLDHIGLYADPAGEQCYLQLQAGVTDSIYVLAILPNLGGSGITAAEFAVYGLPAMDDPDLGYWMASWNSDLVLGSPDVGISLAFGEPQTGTVVVLGQIIFTPTSVEWVGVDHPMAIGRTFGSGVINLVTHDYDEIQVPGNELVLNCGDPGSCPCQVYPCSVSPGSIDFGAIPGGYYGSQDFSLANIGQVSISGEITSSDENFIFASGGGFYTIEPGEILEGVILYVPLTIGQHEGIIETGSDFCLDIPCSGEALTSCEVIPSSPLEFGDVPLGEHVDMGFRIKNNNLHGPNISGCIDLECPGFTVLSGGEEFVLTSGQSRHVMIRFAPLSLGEQSCTVNLCNDFCGEMILTGRGVENPGSHVATEHVGIFAAGNGAGCESDLVSGDLLVLHILAVLPDSLPGGVSEAEFVVAGRPLDNGAEGGESSLHFADGTSVTWNHEVVHLEFPEPQFGRFVNLATLHLLQSEDSWTEDDHVISIAGPPVLTDGLGGIHQIPGGAFTLDCTDLEACSCGNFDTPACIVENNPLEFGFVLVGESADSSFRIINVGGVPLEGQAAIDCPEFSIIRGAEPYQLATGESHLVTVQYEPVDLGDDQCLLDGDICPEVLVTGSSDHPPSCGIQPAELDFGEVIVGESGEASFTVTNTGGCILEGEVTLTNDHFSLISGGGGFTLGADQSRTVVVSFTPSAMEHFEGEIGFGSEICLEALPLHGQGRPLGATGEQIGLFADAAGTICAAETAPGESDTLWVIAKLPFFSTFGFQGARFSLPALPENGNGGTWTAIWNGDTATGDPLTAIALGFETTQWGESVELGRLIFTPDGEDWLGDDQRLEVMGGGGDSQPLLLDPVGNEWTLVGGWFTWNCTDPGGCPCEDYVTPICRLEQDHLDFGTIDYPGSTHRILTIHNTGQGVLEGDLTLPSADFYFYSGGGPFALGPGDSLEAGVRFRPTWVGEFSSTLFTGLPGCPEVLLTGGSYLDPQSNPYQDCLVSMFVSFDPDTCHAQAVGDLQIDFYALLGLQFLWDGFRGVEFRVENWPKGSGFGAVVEEWYADQVAGNLSDGINLQFDPAYGGWEYNVHLGTAYLYITDPGFFGDDHRLDVVEHPASGMLRAWFRDGQPYPIRGGTFTFNCTDPDSCDCTFFDPWVPVAVSLFHLSATPGHVTARWEAELSGQVEFRLEGRLGTETWQPAFEVTAPGRYRSDDSDPALAAGGEVLYTLSARDPGEEWLVMRQESVRVPEARFETALLPGYPNPFNPRVTLPFTLAEPQQLRLVVYDVAGRRVTTVAEGVYPAGAHQLIWDGRESGGHEATSGVYFVRLELAGDQFTRKLVLLR